MLVFSTDSQNIRLAQILMNDYKVMSHWYFASEDLPQEARIPVDISWKIRANMKVSWKYVPCAYSGDAAYIKKLYNEYLESINQEPLGL